MWQVGTVEMAQTMAVNAIAPFVICSKLKSSMMPPFPFPLSSSSSSSFSPNGKAKRSANKENLKKESKEENASSSSSLPLPLPLLDECYSHIVNVTALEGKFNVGKKSGGHPHTVSE